jgi:signal transduction histidine kinase
MYGIVDAHHGEISVHSKLGEGTTFTVTLPVHGAAAAAGAA